MSSVATGSSSGGVSGKADALEDGWDESGMVVVGGVAPPPIGTVVVVVVEDPEIGGPGNVVVVVADGFGG